ncbi:MAG TPA: heavy-metal-associated domain-containing protein [Nitrospirae bacterium]|nr:heavy-metal-associated domain protein [bacterium BMS3Abin10]GBE38953.1 heavy-metal-associated domain protein [bacterium BMS3Bbin08]HDK17243.1 heavy-metal-associated domain-containing protein [Nitrospirota bacterium]HDK82031.1 heavy-metal-associated domain-containing protein [Nitrospirota bacterium]
MATLSFKIGHVYCYDCVKAVGKFVGKMKGVLSVEVKNNDSAVIEYDPSRIEFSEEKFRRIVMDCIDRLGFRIKKT